MTNFRANSIYRLLTEKFPRYSAHLQKIGGAEVFLQVPYDIKAPGLYAPPGLTFHSELTLLSDEELFKADKQRIIRKIQAEDDAHPLNGIIYLAYDQEYEFYARASVWKMEEAAALLVGRNPETFNSSSIKKYGNIPKSAREYKKIIELLKRAILMRQLLRRNTPGKIIGWAESIGIEVPEDLKNLVVKFNHKIINPRSIYNLPDGNVLSAEKVKQSIFDPDVPQSESTKELKQRERSNLLRLVIGLAVVAYKYDPKTARSTVPKELSDDLIKLGIQLSDDTVRKYLKEAAEFHPLLNDR